MAHDGQIQPLDTTGLHVAAWALSQSSFTSSSDVIDVDIWCPINLRARGPMIGADAIIPLPLVLFHFN